MPLPQFRCKVRVDAGDEAYAWIPSEMLGRVSGDEWEQIYAMKAETAPENTTVPR